MKKTTVIAAVLLACLIGFWIFVRPSQDRLTRREIEVAAGLARIHCNEGNHGQAIRIYSDLLERTGQAPFVRLGLAAALLEKGDLREAEEHYRVLLTSDKHSPVVIYNLARTLHLQNRREEAAKYFTKFVRMYEEVLPELAEKARSLAESGPTPEQKRAQIPPVR